MHEARGHNNGFKSILRASGFTVFCMQTRSHVEFAPIATAESNYKTHSASHERTVCLYAKLSASSTRFEYDHPFSASSNAPPNGTICAMPGIATRHSATFHHH